MQILLTSLLALTASAAPPGPSQEPKTTPPEEAKSVWEYLAGRYDKDGDGRISKDEYSRGDDAFSRLDRDGNGFIESADTESARGGRGGRGERGQRGQRGQRRGGEGRQGQGRPMAPREGERAPDFELETLYPAKPEKGKAEAKDKAKDSADQAEEAAETFRSVKLSSFQDKRPVALIFGSYT